MKIAVISDIHGNISALEAVLEDIASLGVEMIVNLGDSLSGGLQPAATASRLIDLDFPTIRGNHERQLLDLSLTSMDAADHHARAALSPKQLEWVRALPQHCLLESNVLMVHGTPARDDACFLETVTPDGIRQATLAEISERAEGAAADVILCGHTHIQREARLADGRFIVNPGSVGLQAYRELSPYPHVVECGTPHARYAVIEKTGETWGARFQTVEYDWNLAANASLANGFTQYESALRTGRLSYA
jgi:putative phosphoesterase